MHVPAAGVVGIAGAAFVKPAPAGFAMSVMKGMEGKAASAVALRVMVEILRRRWIMAMKVGLMVVVLAAAVAVPVGMVAGEGGGNVGTTTAPSEVAAAATTEADKPDMSTPLGMMRMFNDSLMHSDREELHRILYAVTPQQQEMATTMVDTMKRMSELKREVATWFGEKAIAQSRALRMGGQMEAKLADAHVHIDGDHAEVLFTSVARAQPFELEGEGGMADCHGGIAGETADGGEKIYRGDAEAGGEVVADSGGFEGGGTDDNAAGECAVGWEAVRVCWLSESISNGRHGN